MEKKNEHKPITKATSQKAQSNCVSQPSEEILLIRSKALSRFKNEYIESELYQRANQKLLSSKIPYIDKKTLFNLFIEELILF